MLVVSHDFPPVRSPQAIRAAAFVRQLARVAARVDVVSRSDIEVYDGPPQPPNVHLHPCSPGWFEATLDRRAALKAARQGAGGDEAAPLRGPTALNWKGRLVTFLRRVADLLRFPDGRAAWVAPARRELRRICREHRPEVALVMHEPAACLLVAKELSRMGVPWLADLADPVLAPYTPRHWRRRALRLEARTIANAAAISVTNAATAELLAARHGIDAASVTILPQGFDERRPARPRRGGDALELVYTGRFYPFREPTPLLEAVAATPGVRLTIAGPELPKVAQAAAARHPQAIVLAGELRHEAALAMQAGADVLVSIGNANTTQSPGKLQEYFGARHPILHIYGCESDPAIALLGSTGRGWSCPADAKAIAASLQRLVALKAGGGLGAAFNLDDEAVAAFRWDRIADQLVATLAGLARPPAAPAG